MEKKKIVVACGGTGGHAFPGLAVARELLARGHDVAVWDSGRLVESDVMRGWQGGTFSTGARQLTLGSVLPNLFALLRCRRELKKFRPNAMLAMGSYSSLPPVLAAKMSGVPVVLHVRSRRCRGSLRRSRFRLPSRRSICRGARPS